MFTGNTGGSFKVLYQTSPQRDVNNLPTITRLLAIYTIRRLNRETNSLKLEAMENFSLPVLVNSITFGSTNSNKNNNNNKSHIITQMHHHKDQMLAAGSTPSTTAFLYETPSVVKPEMSMAKSDYATFASCIQQSALLDHRVDTNLETNLDGTVSLRGLGLCDLKFANTNNLMGANSSSNVLCTDANNYKHLPPLPMIETNSLFVAGNGSELAKGSASPTGLSNNLQNQFSNIVHFNRDPLPEAQTRYVTFKENEEPNTAEHPEKFLSNVNTQMLPPPSTGSADDNCGAGLMEFTIEATEKSTNFNNLRDDPIVNVTTATVPIITATVKNTANTNTTVITTMAASIATSNINVNLQQQQQQQQQQSQQQQQQQQQQQKQQQNVSSSMHSIEEVGLNSIAITPSSAISSSAVSISIDSPRLNPSPPTVANILSITSSVPTQQSERQRENQRPRSVQADQQNHQNCSNISTDSNEDSLSSSEEFLEMDINERPSGAASQKSF
uniref:Uncharacterized protein n=1 Tax=Glossina brevipalpis TaxID=37001 RepID=A0A1A9WS84_9MUSC